MADLPTYPKYPSDFSRRNRVILAERLRWPDGALKACSALEDAHPGWRVWWMAENTTPGFERPAGFHAEFKHPFHRTEVTAPTVEAIEALLVDVPDHEWSTSGCDYCRARL